MKARKVKALRRRQKAERRQQQWEAADEFVGTCSYLLISLPDDYDCYLTCDEAEAAAALLLAFGVVPEHVEELMKDHGKDDEPGERHHVCDDRCDLDCGEEIDE